MNRPCALGELVKAAPQCAKAARDTLIKAVGDSSYEVRAAAASALLELVKAAPQYAQDAHAALLKAVKDDRNDWWREARTAATAALEVVEKVTRDQVASEGKKRE